MVMRLKLPGKLQKKDQNDVGGIEGYSAHSRVYPMDRSKVELL